MRKTMTWNLINHTVAFVLVLLASTTVLAQSTNATLAGVVADAQNAAIPNAGVSLVEIANGKEHRAVSSGSGNYSLTDLPIGDYKVTISAAGFKSEVIPSITLHVNQAAALNFKLEVGSVSDSVVVTAEIPLVNTESSSVGQVIDNKSIESQPLNGREFWQLVALVPGASYTPGGEGSDTGGSSIRSSVVNVQINGTGEVFNGWLLDGADITEYEQGGTNIQPDVDALSEFKVFTANMPAEYGHTPNAVTVTMKSGTNSIHGTAFEFIRNDVLDAHNYFSRTSKNILRRNQFGGTVGGPIRRNKVFFFSDFETSRQSQGEVFANIVPSDAMRTGDFSASKTIKDPQTGLPFPGNIIPANRISNQAKFFLSYLPTQSQALFSTSQTLNILKGDAKIDAALTPSDQLMGRYSIADNTEQNPNQFPKLQYQSLRSRAQNIALSETHTFGSHWLNEARAGYYRDYFNFGAILAGTNFDQMAGITGYELTQQVPSFPYITLSGYSAFNGSHNGNLPKQNRIQTWEYADTVSYNKGKHEVKFGFQLWDQHHSFVHGQGQEGEFDFTTQYTGDAFGDFLLGLPASVFRSYPLTVFGVNGRELAAFAEDTYHVTKNFTLDYGIRWERNPFFNGNDGVTTAFDYNTGKIVVPMRNGQLIDPTSQAVTAVLLPVYSDRLVSASSLGLPESIRKTGPGQLAPRFGFAYNPGGSGKFVIRSAFGIFPIFLDTNLSQNAAQAPPFLIAQTLNNPIGTPAFNWANPFNGQPLVAPNPNPGTPCPGTTLVLLSCVASSFATELTQLQHTYMEQYNLEVQSQLRKDISLTVGYVGNHTVHAQLYAVPTNVPNPGPGSVQLRRQFPQWGQINAGITSGYAHYDALQTSLEKRFGGGVYALVSYVYSKCLDNGSSESAPIDIQLLPQNYAVCSYDMTHNLTISSILDLPFGKGHRFLGDSGRLVNGVVGGWQIAGIFTDRTGQPYTPVISSDIANIGVSGQWPNRVGNAKLAHPTAQKWFDPTAFAIPLPYTIGNSRRDVLRSQGFVNLDATLKKNFPLPKGRDIELRFEAFNVANHPTFNAPSATIGSSSAGIVSSTLNANRIFQAALKIFF
jgi:hypothetical protein